MFLPFELFELIEHHAFSLRNGWCIFYRDFILSVSNSSSFMLLLKGCVLHIQILLLAILLGDDCLVPGPHRHQLLARVSFIHIPSLARASSRYDASSLRSLVTNLYIEEYSLGAAHHHG